MNKLRIYGVLFISVLFSACATTSETIYKGRYFYNFENSSFTPEGSQESWCISSHQMQRAQLPEKKSTGGTSDVTIRGKLSPEGHYCNLGASKHVLNVDQLLEVTNMQ